MTVTGTAAGVPYTAHPPADPDVPAPVIVVWHLGDAPRTDTAMAAALPLPEVPAWRVYLGLPWCGARMPNGGLDEVIARVQRDPVLDFLHPLITQAADEFPAALTALRDQLPLADGPVSLVGGSAGGAVALLTLTRGEIPVRAAAVINPAIRLRSAIGVIEGAYGMRYPWSAESSAAADELDFVARAGELGDAPLLVVSGAEDYPDFRRDVVELAELRPGVTVREVAGLAHPLAAEPGLAAAPQLPIAAVVDGVVGGWLRERMG